MNTIINEAPGLRHYSTKSLARFYGVCDKTLLKWMKPYADDIGPRQGRYFTVAQVGVIFQKLGRPPALEPARDKETKDEEKIFEAQR